MFACTQDAKMPENLMGFQAWSSLPALREISDVVLELAFAEL